MGKRDHKRGRSQRAHLRRCGLDGFTMAPTDEERRIAAQAAERSRLQDMARTEEPFAETYVLTVNCEDGSNRRRSIKSEYGRPLLFDGMKEAEAYGAKLHVDSWPARADEYAIRYGVIAKRVT